jgi:hypothetical protein
LSYVNKRLHVKYPCPLFSLNLIDLEFLRQIFEKFSNIKFYDNLSSGSLSMQIYMRTDGQTDRETDEKAVSGMSQFCERT